MTLDQLAIKNGTDKSSLHHDYCGIYASYLDHKRDMPVSLLELGYGGYDFPNRGGESAKMWLEYFTHSDSVIISTDIHPKNHADINDKRFVFMKADQANILASPFVLNHFDIIIDDASHICPETIKTFETYFPMVQPGGIYIIEDLHCSFYEEIAHDGYDFKGLRDSKNLNDPIPTNMLYNLCNELVIGSRTDIKAVHFYREMAIILKA